VDSGDIGNCELYDANEKELEYLLNNVATLNIYRGLRTL